MLCIEPPDAWQEEPTAYLRMQTYDSGAKLPTHRDYLGSLLGLGLGVYAVVLADKAEFITVNFTSAGHSPVHVETCTELPPRLLTGPERELHEATVSALRADAVLAALMHTSRTKAAEYIAAGRVEVNHLPLRAAHEAMYEADIITVRGVGRFRLAEIGGKSKKDRQFISFYQY